MFPADMILPLPLDSYIAQKKALLKSFTISYKLRLQLPISINCRNLYCGYHVWLEKLLYRSLKEVVKVHRGEACLKAEQVAISYTCGGSYPNRVLEFSNILREFCGFFGYLLIGSS